MMKSSLQKKLSRNRRDWWLCENDACAHPLGKIIKGSFFDMEIVEIEGKNGEKFYVKAEWIDTFCRKCGARNTISGGRIAGEEQDVGGGNRNGREPASGASKIREFFVNSYKRNRLLSKLTDKQKQLFSLIMENGDGALDRKKAAETLGVSEKILADDLSAIYRTADEVEDEVGNEIAEKTIHSLRQTLAEIKRSARSVPCREPGCLAFGGSHNALDTQ